MTDERSDPGPLHSMAVLCRKTGLKSDRVRAWERRYHVVEPIRSGGNHRLFHDRDVEKLQLLRQATDGGHRIARIAHLSLQQLHELVDDLAPGSTRPPSRGAADAAALVAPCLAAVQQLDAEWLRAELVQARQDLTTAALTQQLIVPLIRDIGELWAEGGLTPAHEHLGTAVLRSFLEELRASAQLASDAPRLVTATPAGEVHELGALLAAATATESRWRVIHLGSNLPSVEIAGAARQTGAQAIGLSVVCPADEDTVRSELAMLRRHMGHLTGLIIGGRAARSFEDIAAELDVVLVEDLAGLPPALALFA